MNKTFVGISSPSLILTLAFVVFRVIIVHIKIENWFASAKLVKIYRKCKR